MLDLTSCSPSPTTSRCSRWSRIFAAEFALLRPGLDGKSLNRLGKIDRAYGAIAGLVLVVGLLRVIFGGTGWEYYAGNWAFWVKMAAFLGVGLLSIPPTIAIIRWRKAGTPPADADVNTARRYLHLAGRPPAPRPRLRRRHGEGLRGLTGFRACWVACDGSR